MEHYMEDFMKYVLYKGLGHLWIQIAAGPGTAREDRAYYFVVLTMEDTMHVPWTPGREPQRKFVYKQYLDQKKKKKGSVDTNRKHSNRRSSAPTLHS